MNETNYKQYDSRWSGLPYPKKPWNIGNSGCGEVAVCNCIIEMEAYKNETPKTMQPYCKQYAAPNGDGTYWSGIPAMMKHYGMTDVMEHATMPALFREMAKGNRVAVLLMGSRPGGTKRVHWTSGGHYIAATAFKIEGGKNWLYIKDSNSTSSLRNGWMAYEDNIKGDCLKVWSGQLTGKAATTPTSKPATTKDGKLVVDGVGGMATVRRLQEFLGVTQTDGITIKKDLQKYVPALTAYDYGTSSPTVKAMQKWLGLSNPDGLWGPNTSKGLQKKLGVKQDGIAGTETFKALQKYLNEHDKAIYPTPPAPTSAEKLIAQADRYCWPYGTPERNWQYKTGAPTDTYKIGLKYYMGKTSKADLSDCGYFIDTCVRASGLGKDFLVLKGAKRPFPPVPSNMTIVHKGKKVPDGLLKAGDIIRYKKTNGGQHTLMYYGDGKIAEAGRRYRFPVIRKDTGKYNANDVVLSTIEVIRAK